MSINILKLNSLMSEAGCKACNGFIFMILTIYSSSWTKVAACYYTFCGFTNCSWQVSSHECSWKIEYLMQSFNCISYVYLAIIVAVPNQHCCHLHHLIGGVFCLPLINHKFLNFGGTYLKNGAYEYYFCLYLFCMPVIRL